LKNLTAHWNAPPIKEICALGLAHSWKKCFIFG
jgi:hypothetical protein